VYQASSNTNTTGSRAILWMKPERGNLKAAAPSRREN